MVDESLTRKTETVREWRITQIGDGKNEIFQQIWRQCLVYGFFWVEAVKHSTESDVIRHNFSYRVKSKNGNFSKVLVCLT